jgi:hypothetical protein
MQPKGRRQEPDLQTQFESLLDQVWQSEADWSLWDRVDAAVMHEALRLKRLSNTGRARGGMTPDFVDPHSEQSST